MNCYKAIKMKVDMSPEAVTRRLKQTEELRRLCLALGYKRYTDFKKNSSKKSIPSR